MVRSLRRRRFELRRPVGQKWQTILFRLLGIPGSGSQGGKLRHFSLRIAGNVEINSLICSNPEILTTRIPLFVGRPIFADKIGERATEVGATMGGTGLAGLRKRTGRRSGG